MRTKRLMQREENRSEKAESIKSRIIEAISRMDDGEIDKLRSVLRLENAEMAGRLGVNAYRDDGGEFEETG